MTEMRSHPLLDELKSDLEVAYDHFKRVSEQMSAAKFGRLDQSLVNLKRSELGICLDLLTSASERFRIYGDIYATAIAAPNDEAAIEAILSQLEGLGEALVDRHTVQNVERYVAAVSDFMSGNNMTDANRQLRSAWGVIEDYLRSSYYAWPHQNDMHMSAAAAIS